MSKTQYRFRKPIVKKVSSKEIDFSKLLPYLAPLLIFLGVTRLSFYYYQFKIKIFPFLEFTEIITSFLDLIILFIFVIATVAIVIHVADIDYLEKSKKGILFFFIIILSIFGSFILLLRNQLDGDNMLIVLFLILIILVLTAIFRSKNYVFESEFYHNLIYYLSILSVVMIALYCISWVDVYKVRVFRRYCDVKIYYNDKTIFVSDSNVYYIGNTNKYVFIYNTKTKTSKVEKMDDVKAIEFPYERISKKK